VLRRSSSRSEWPSTYSAVGASLSVGFFILQCLGMSNATLQARREAGAQRTLYAVACKRLPSKAELAGTV
jgi:hypothetical protein